MPGLTPPRTAQTLVEEGAARLAGFPNPTLDAEMLYRGLSGWSRADLLGRGAEAVSSELSNAFEAAIVRRLQHEPIQYILGRADFWRDEFLVTPAVLIPRPDTEILVEAVAKRLSGRPRPRFLDVGTGSGCIALSLLRELPTASSVALDVSSEALVVATENAARLGLSERLTLRQSRWLSAISGDESFDAVVSNPPYVAPSEEATLPREVREFEPGLALYADPNDDLSSYRQILSEIPPHLAKGGLIAFEVGLGQSQRVADLLRSRHFAGVDVVKDLAGIERVVLGVKA